jgi:tetratricopeptide (TPR) repeat protein
MLWKNIPTAIPLDIHLCLQRQIVSRRPHDAARWAALGEILLGLAEFSEAVTAFEHAEALDFRNFRHFDKLAECYRRLGRPDAALRVCERGIEITPDASDLHTKHGIALWALGRRNEARMAYLKALALSPDAFDAAESLLWPLASDPDGAKLLSLCEQFPPAYASSTVVRGYRAIALSRVGHLDEARSLVDLDRYPASITFDPPPEFGGIERFNKMLADEILRNPGLRYTPTYKFYRTECLALPGAPAYRALAKFLCAAIEGYIAEFAQRGLDMILPAPPREACLGSAGNVVRSEESHDAHLHVLGYISGVYHVSVPPEVTRTNDRLGALVLGSCCLRDGYVPCWGSRDIKPVPGVATLFPSHIFHSVVPTYSDYPRIAVPFDLNVAPTTKEP